MTGDKITHNGKTWISTINNNVWEPSVTAGNKFDHLKNNNLNNKEDKQNVKCLN